MLNTIAPRQEILDAIQARFRQKVEPKSSSRAMLSLVPPPTAHPDDTLIHHAINARNGAAFRALWIGDTSGYDGDDSAADMALCSYLAFWTGKNASQIDRLFRQSGLMRPKWNELHGSETYGDRTIRKAIDLCQNSFGQQLGAAGTQVVEPYHPSFTISDWRASTAFAGEPKPRKYLVDSIFPMGQVSLLCAQGGVGKSFSLLSLMLEVAREGGRWLAPVIQFGGSVKEHGPAVYLSGEDDDIELHQRLDTLGGKPDRLYPVPLPSAGGAPILFKTDPKTREPMATQAWDEICRQLREIHPVVFGLDPLQVFCALDLNDPGNAQFVCSRLSALSAELGAAIIVTHHFKKTTVSNSADAREAIRGTAGLVDGVRAVYVMWPAPPGKGDDQKGAKAICKALGIKYEPDKIVFGAVVKANGKANRKVITSMRGDSGLLVDVTSKTSIQAAAPSDLKELLREAIAHAAKTGQPYTKTGRSGLYERRPDLGEPLVFMSKGRLTNLVDELLKEGGVVQALGPGSKTTRWLDIPDGPFAQGVGEFRAGAMSSAKVA